MIGPTRAQRVADTTADALRRGDRQAFEELFVQLRGDVYNLAARIVGDRGEAEDLAQEVFLRAFRHLPGKTDQVSPEAWVFRTTVNACYDHLRRRKPAPVELATEREAVAHDAVEQAAMAAAVEEALGRLNPRYRTALVLKDLHGFGNGEIAEIMGVARGTVGVLLFRARGAFEKRYREIAPTLGAGLPVAGLAAWLPSLPVPATLLGPPAFVAPLAAAPLAPAMVPAAPLAAGLAKLAGALTTKAAVVAIAATAVTGGGIAVYEARDAGPAGAATATTMPASSGHDEGASYPLGHDRTHAALASEAAHRPHHSGDHDGSVTGDLGGRQSSGDGTHAGDGAHTGDGSAGATGDTSDGGTHTGDGSAGATGGTSDGGTHTGDGTSGGTTDTGTHTGDGDTGGHTPAPD